MKTITCDKCGKKLNLEKDIVTINEIGEGHDRQFSIFGKYFKYDVCVELKIKGLFDFCDDEYNDIYEDICIDCLYEIIKEIVGNKTKIEWTRED